MKKIRLSNNKYALVDDIDFEKLNVFKWYAHKGWGTNFYAVRNLRLPNGKRKIIRMHNVIFGDLPKNKTVDHIDRDSLNNQRNNLRACTKSQNAQNVGIRVDNTSGCKGVSWDRNCKKWRVQISINKKQTYLGVFSDKNKANSVFEDTFSKLNH